MDVKATVYAALHADAALLALLPDGDVFMDKSPDAGTYPVVVVQEVDDVPQEFADNAEIWRRLRYQVSVLTADGEAGAIEALIRADMAALGFQRSTFTEIMDGPESNQHHVRVLQFTIATNAEV